MNWWAGVYSPPREEGNTPSPTNLKLSHGGIDMRVVTLCLLIAGFVTPAFTQTTNDPVKVLVGRLDLEKYKATINSLTQFGDRRQGTDRNREAIDWIEAQLKSYGCTNPERL